MSAYIPSSVLSAAAALAIAGTIVTNCALADTPSLVLINGKVITLDASSTVASALAIRDDSILAVGNNQIVKQAAGPGANVIDLGGRTVIPGLIDSHIHAIRTALTFGVETDWSAISSLGEGLQIVSDAAKKSPGAWIIVAGGWHEDQVQEHRGPTGDELAKAAPDNPVFVQHLYDYAALNPKALELLGVDSDSKLPPAGRLVRDANGRATGAIHGDLQTYSRLYARVANPDFAGQVSGTQAFFKALNSVGVTGIIDAAGGGMPPANYYPLFQVWQQGNLSVRVAFYVNGQTPGQEVKDVKEYFQLIPSNFGDDKLKILGLGEIVIWGMHDGPAGKNKTFKPKPEALAGLKELAAWAAERRLRIQIHSSTNSNAVQILDIFEEINSATPITDLRWTIAHLEDAAPETLARMKRLGIGWAVQDRLYFEGEVWPKVMGMEAAKTAPPIADAIKAGVIVAGGTDGPRAAPYNPFVTLEWLVTGKTVKGTILRSKEQSPTREQALRIHTVNSAWMAGDDGRRGTLEPGKWADLVVLSDDYISVPDDKISQIKALVVGGKVQHAAPPFSQLTRTPR